MNYQRWLWLLVLPYVVTVSSNMARIDSTQHPGWSPMACSGDTKDTISNCKEWMEDEAEALNQAHERRTTKHTLRTETDQFKNISYGTPGDSITVDKYKHQIEMTECCEANGCENCGKPTQ